MSLTIDLDPHGRARVPFNEFRDQLLASGGKFTARELERIPYQQLALTLIANAGSAAAEPEDVAHEKARRRRRFLSMSPEELAESRRYLQGEGMYGDLLDIIARRRATPWDACSHRIKLWLKLNCLHNHIDHPRARLREASKILFTAQAVGEVEEDIFQSAWTAIDELALFYPEMFSAAQFRMRLASVAEDILGTLGVRDVDICRSGLISGYSCTSDCYRTMI